jgi:hypothetical protein
MSQFSLLSSRQDALLEPMVAIGRTFELAFDLLFD